MGEYKAPGKRRYRAIQSDTGINMAVTVEDKNNFMHLSETAQTTVDKTSDNKALDATEKKYGNLKPFKPGKEWKGNAKGRPKGSRNKLSERFLEDMHDLWKRRGMQVLESVAEKQPEKLLSAMVQVLPKDFQVSITDDNEQRWVIDARPLSIEEWQQENGLLPKSGKHQPLESDT